MIRVAPLMYMLVQRHQTLPPAQTSSARAALQSFYCDLCSKGYSRMNDYEAHLSSYDHSHRQRMKDMKQMVKDPTAGARARRAEAKADGLISIKLGSAGGGDGNIASGNGNDGKGGAAAGGFKKGGFKKSGFKSAFGPVGGGGTEDVEMKMDKAPVVPGREDASTVMLRNLDVESDTEDEGYELYDPRFPTD
ncbi:putative c2h2 type zinc finger containing protein [Rosellinia necatrix]|uniref:Putative c2h2 type zinc finger containing protein n=1 Tax=Rosellinia necatrix TaxID=77044 RepID=A0A1W2TIM4_ROSNE|nr:putative c2h2 type zinc finger containing protein [Rosellinia necatrix]